MPTPLKSGPKLLPTSRRRTSSKVSSPIFLESPATLFKSSSWSTTRTPSFVTPTSSSIQSAPLSMAASNAGIVFSGASDESPLWAVISTFSSQLSTFGPSVFPFWLSAFRPSIFPFQRSAAQAAVAASPAITRAHTMAAVICLIFIFI